MSRRRPKAGPAGEDCMPMMDYAPTIVECIDNGILHGATDYGSYADIYIPHGSMCHIPGCDEACSENSRYCEAHATFGRYCKARTRHQMEVVRRLLSERKQEAQSARQTS
jgi:hypothetical protein